MAKTVTTKTTNGIYYLLYQTDIWQSKSSYVCFELFQSYELANEVANINRLKTSETNVVIQPIKINQFAEVL